MKFSIPIIPRGQARARHAVTKSGLSMTYKSADQRQAEQNLCALLLPFRPEKPLEGPLTLRVFAYRPIPASWSQKKKQEAVTRRLRPIGKPDLDNLIKHLKDCLGQVGFWCDDKQVVRLFAIKCYSTIPGWEIELTQTKEAEK